MPTPGQEAANLIREEIARLTRALAMLEGDDERYSPEPREPAVRTRRGRPAGSGTRQMSPEARERIAAAQRARWNKSRQQVTPQEPPAAEQPAEPQSSQEIPQATEAAPDVVTAEPAVKPPKRRK